MTSTQDAEVQPVVRRRVARRRRRQRRITVVQSLFTVLAAAALIGLVVVGWRSAMRITGGSEEVVTDPAAPGYLAEVRPTATTLVAVTGDGGELITMLVVVADPASGRMTVAPMSPQLTLWDFEEAGPQSAAEVFADGGLDLLQLRLGADLTFGMTEAVTLPGAALASVVPGPVTVQLADDVFEGDPLAEPADTTVRFPAGEQQIEPDQLDDFLAFVGYREPESNRALRVGELWAAMLEAAVVPPDAAAFGPTGDGEALAELFADMSEADVSTDLVPTIGVPLDVLPPVTIYRIDGEAMPAWISTRVPFPIAAYPGQFATVAILDGTGVDGAIRTVAPRVVAAGAEIALTGNAESFDEAATRVEYHRDESRAAAERIAESLGVSATADLDDPISVDVTVVVGKDLVP